MQDTTSDPTHKPVLLSHVLVSLNRAVHLATQKKKKKQSESNIVPVLSFNIIRQRLFDFQTKPLNQYTIVSSVHETSRQHSSNTQIHSHPPVTLLFLSS